jgi:hypothetical protein
VDAVTPVCSLCGRRPASQPLRVSENFVSYPDLYAGDGVCNVCGMLLRDKRFRSSHWVMAGDEVKILSKDELLQVLRSPPPGSLIYVKSGGRRHGFLRGLRFASSNSLVALAGEDEGVILVRRERLAELVKLAEEAYGKLGRKAPLLDGCGARDWVHEDICKRVEQVRGDPAWRIIVRAL